MKEPNSVIESVKEFAAKAHGDQKRKYTPDPYIVHPVRVMEICRERTEDVTVLAAALLHDVLEDTPVKSIDILEFLKANMSAEQANRTLKMVEELTDVYVKAAYPNLNRRTRKQKELERMKTISPESQTVKYADVIDNCREIVVHDPSFAKVFLKECQTMLKILNKGDSKLYEEARELIHKKLNQLGGRSRA